MVLSLQWTRGGIAVRARSSAPSTHYPLHSPPFSLLEVIYWRRRILVQAFGNWHPTLHWRRRGHKTWFLSEQADSTQEDRRLIPKIDHYWRRPTLLHRWKRHLIRGNPSIPPRQIHPLKTNGLRIDWHVLQEQGNHLNHETYENNKTFEPLIDTNGH